MKKMIIVKSENESLFSIGKRTEMTTFVIEEDSDVRMDTIRGHDPYIEEVYAGLFEVIGKEVTEYRRTNKFRFCSRTGMSGCTDYYIEVEEYDKLPSRKFIMHESMLGKIPGIRERTFLYDLLDLGRALGFVAVEEGKYSPSEHLKEKMGKMIIKVVEPRNIEKEEGWGEYRLVDIHNVVRADERFM